MDLRYVAWLALGFLTSPAHAQSDSTALPTILNADFEADGTGVAAPTPATRRRQRPSSSNAICAAAATKAKSLCLALTSWKPTPMRGPRHTGKLTEVRQPAAGSAVIIGPMKKSDAETSVVPVPFR